MRANRVLIAASVALGAGLWTLFTYGHGTSGLSFALPVAGSRSNLDLTTTGLPVILGVPLTALGFILMVIAFVLAVAEQFRRTPAASPRDATVPSRTRPFAETDPVPPGATITKPD